MLRAWYRFYSRVFNTISRTSDMVLKTREKLMIPKNTRKLRTSSIRWQARKVLLTNDIYFSSSRYALLITKIALIKKKCPLSQPNSVQFFRTWSSDNLSEHCHMGLTTRFNRLYFLTQKEVYPLNGVLNSYLLITKLLRTRHELGKVLYDFPIHI